jgi:hypothetical protein
MFGTTLSGDAKTALAILAKSGLVGDGYLAGGSSLALHFGHRYSLDFDFFSQKTFDPHKLAHDLKKIGQFKQTIAKGISLIGEFNKIKFSYFQYNYPLIGKLSSFLGINIASVDDIAAMKIVALMDRGTKRDFVDLYEIIRRGKSLEDILKLYDKKYKTLEENMFSIIKSLQYFDDAQDTDMPKMIASVSWEKAKEFFTSESMRLAHKYI